MSARAEAAMEPADLPDPLAEAPPSIVIALPKPLKGAGEIEYGEIPLREPTVGELMQVDTKSGYAWTVALVALISGVPTKVVEQVPVSFLNAANAYLSVFIKAARRIGAGG